MADFARVNQENIVTYVTQVDISICGDPEGGVNDEIAINHLYETIPDSVGDRWIRTSFDPTIRKNRANIGDTYDENLDAFIPQKVFESWILDTNDCKWKSPIGDPPVKEGYRYIWNESELSWEEVAE
jgi:hypothetical protein